MTTRAETRTMDEPMNDSVLVDPSHIITPGIGTSVVIPDAGYILDLIVFYDTLLVAEYGSADAVTR